MPKRMSRKAIDRLRHQDYRKVADHFYEAAEIAIEYTYWTAAGVLIVHSAIAYADAIVIKLSGKKSSSDRHEDAVGLLDEVVAESEGKKRALTQLARIIEEKTLVSYSGDLYDEASVRGLQKNLERFRSWALGVLER